MPTPENGSPSCSARKPERPIGGWVAGTGRTDARISSTRSAAEEFDTQLAAIACVENVDVVTVGLETCFDDVPAMRVNKNVVELCDGGRKLFYDARRSEVLQRSSINVCNRATGKTEQRKAVDVGGIAVGNTDLAA